MPPTSFVTYTYRSNRFLQILSKNPTIVLTFALHLLTPSLIFPCSNIKRRFRHVAGQRLNYEIHNGHDWFLQDHPLIETVMKVINNQKRYHGPIFGKGIWSLLALFLQSQIWRRRWQKETLDVKNKTFHFIISPWQRHCFLRHIIGNLHHFRTYIEVIFSTRGCRWTLRSYGLCIDLFSFWLIFFIQSEDPGQMWDVYKGDGKIDNVE